MSEPEFTHASFYRFLTEKKLMGSRCKGCGELFLPPRPICTKCYGREMEWTELGGKGKLVAYTAVAVGVALKREIGYDRKRLYCSGVVELNEGVNIPARIKGVDTDNPETIKIGTPVVVEFLESGEGEEKRITLGFKAITS